MASHRQYKAIWSLSCQSERSYSAIHFFSIDQYTIANAQKNYVKKII